MMHLNQRQLIIALSSILVISLGMLAVILSERTDNRQIVTDVTEYRGTTYNPPVELTDFTLPASTGEDLNLSDLGGQWVLLFFGYTHCPDFCPFTLLEFRQVVEMLGDDADSLQVVFVSVDGERDTPAVLATYLEHYNPNFIGLSGNDETLAQIQADYSLYYERHESEGEYYSVDHTTRSYLIDPQRRLVMSYSYGTDREILAESIREMLIQG